MVPSGLTLVSMTGSGWTCPAGMNTCSRADALNPGLSYPAITATVNVAANAISPQINLVNVTGGGSVQANNGDLTTIVTNSGPASIAATGGTPQSAVVQTAFAKPLQATVTNGSGQPVSGVVVTFTVPASGASGSFAGGANTATTNSSGVATSAKFTANTIAGAYTVTASVSGVSTPASFALTNKAGKAESIKASGGTPQTATIKTAFASPLQATVTDSFGNPVSGATVTFTAPTSGASGTFAGGDLQDLHRQFDCGKLYGDRRGQWFDGNRQLCFNQCGWEAGHDRRYRRNAAEHGHQDRVRPAFAGHGEGCRRESGARGSGDV
jgi:hypothetical protein